MIMDFVFWLWILLLRNEDRDFWNLNLVVQTLEILVEVSSLTGDLKCSHETNNRNILTWGFVQIKINFKVTPEIYCAI